MNLLKIVLVCIASLLIYGCTLTQTIPAAQSTIAPTADAPSLTVAWADSGDLFVWKPDYEFPRRLATGGVLTPYLAPDGKHIAFTRGPAGVPETLWIVDSAGTAESQLVSVDDLVPTTEEKSLIGQIDWWDDSILYFNTLRQNAISVDSENDLYRANIRTEEVALILRRGEGGAFSFSPERTALAVVYPGTYGVQDGRISVIDPLGQTEARDLLYFVGVATGAHYQFYPALHWQDDDTLLTAIPDSDLLYNEASFDAPPVTLWQLETDTTRDVIGEVQASLFGQPVWSADSQSMFYMSREGTVNQFVLYTAGMDGSSPERYASGEAGMILPPLWLSDSRRFIYALDGAYWLGERGEAPQRWAELNPAVMQWPVLAGDYAVYIFLNEQKLELRYADVNSAADDFTIITTFTTSPGFDAVMGAR